ncbi:hypothetical protein [Bacillus thuringiensis]|uniref:hypothetical protein n=1 Tax=Bacillus thuringiensis TaxID=1428 RepID=UPI000BF91B9C|nr:hypothetical protein [Bacillus thuringiensis]PEQ30021.1 hypothetical protein CN471_24840 [Bacillus thuringiensis]
MNSISKVNIRKYNVEELSKGEYLKIEAEKFLIMLCNDYIKSGYSYGSELHLKSKLEKGSMIVKSGLTMFAVDNLIYLEILVKLLRKNNNHEFCDV